MLYSLRLLQTGRQSCPVAKALAWDSSDLDSISGSATSFLYSLGQVTSPLYTTPVFYLYHTDNKNDLLCKFF